MPKRKFRRKLRRYSPRRFARRFRKGKSPIPLLPTIPVVYKALLEPIIGSASGPNSGGYLGAKYFMDQGDLAGAVLEAGNIMSLNFTGFSLKGPDKGTFYPEKLMQTYVPILIGVVGHKLATKFGANRAMKKIPFLGKYVQL